MTDGKNPFDMENPHEAYEHYTSAFEEEPDAEQYLRYSYFEQEPQYAYSHQQSQYPYAQPAYPYDDQQPQYPYTPEQAHYYPYPGQEMPPDYMHNPNPAASGTSSSVPIIALVLGLLSIVIPILAIPAIILGIIGIVKAKKTGTGKGMSIAGLILGLLITVFWALVIAALFRMNFFNDDSDDYIYGAPRPGVSNELVDVEFGEYGEYNGRYGVPVTVTNNSPDTLQITIELQAQTEDGDSVVDESYIIIPALRPGYSHTEIGLYSLIEEGGKEIEKATYVTTEINVARQEVDDTGGRIKFGDFTYKQLENVMSHWETQLDVTYTNTSSNSEESCSFEIVAQDPNTKETFDSSLIFFDDVQPGKSETEPAFQSIDLIDANEKNPWFTRKGLEYDVVDMWCDLGKEYSDD